MALVPVASSLAQAQTAPAVPLCSAGRWVIHDQWPGWRDDCPDPGEVVIDPPFLLCLWHAGDLAARAAAS